MLIGASCGGTTVPPREALAFSARAQTYESAPSEAEGITGEPAALSVGMENFVSADDAVAALIYDRLGIKLIPVNILSDDYAQMARLAASGTLPDLLRVNVASPYFVSLIKDGKLQSWTPTYPRLDEVMKGSISLAAVTKLYGKAYFMPLSEEPAADPGRIYYRKDWFSELGLSEPATTDAFGNALKAIYDSRNRPGLTLAGGVTYLLAMFGADPYGWVYENGEWIPAYYSERMLPGLNYARILYANGWLDFEYAVTKANAAVNKFASGAAGGLIRHGDSLWMQRVLSAFAENYGMGVKEAYDGYVGVLPPLVVSGGGEGATAVWPRSLPSSGIVMPVTSDKMANAQALLNFILSDEAVQTARYGIMSETSAISADGTLRLLIDPSTAEPFDITARYPAAQVLQLMGQPLAQSLPDSVRAGMELTDAQYEAAVQAVDDGYLAHFIHTPARVRLESEINMGAAFNAIVMGGQPVEEMFAAFRALCDEKGIRGVIGEVNAAINGG